MMMLYTDVPTESEFRHLEAVRNEICVSIYLPTSPGSSNAVVDRIKFQNLAFKAIIQLRDASFAEGDIDATERLLSEFQADDDFWIRLADGLAVFATPKEVRSFRLPTAPAVSVEVSDRFYLKPLLPLFSFPGACFVLALSHKVTRLIEVTSSLSEAVHVETLPRNASEVFARKVLKDASLLTETQAQRGLRNLRVQHCRMIDRALRPILAGRSQPLILAADSHLATIYRSHNTYPHLLQVVIPGNPEGYTDGELAAMARNHAVTHAKAVVRRRIKLVQEWTMNGLVSTDLDRIAHAAVRGEIGTLLIDVSASRPGRIDPERGVVALAEKSSPRTYDILDELIGLTMRAGGDVYPINSALLPALSPVAAIFRHQPDHVDVDR